MTDIHNTLRLIREGVTYEATEFSAMMESITSMCESVLLITESTGDDPSILKHIQNALAYLREKVIKFFEWLKRKLSIFQSQKNQTLKSMTKHIRSYSGSHSMQIPEKLFTVDINLKDIEDSIEDWLSEINELQQHGTSDLELHKYPQLLTYKDNLSGLTNNMYRSILTNSFDVRYLETDSRDLLLKAVYGDTVEMHIATMVKPELLIDRLTAFDKFVTVIDDIGKNLANRLDKFSTTYKHLQSIDRPLILRFISALIEGVLKAVTTIYSVVLYGYGQMFNIARMMADESIKQNPKL